MTGHELFSGTALGRALAARFPGWNERHVERIIIDVQADEPVRVYFQETVQGDLLDLDWAELLQDARRAACGDHPTREGRFRLRRPPTAEDRARMWAGEDPFKVGDPFKDGVAYTGLVHGDSPELGRWTLRLYDLPGARFDPAFFDGVGP